MRIHIGEFEAESQWKNNNDAKLPSYIDSNSEKLVNCMDELLFGFADSKDVLITKQNFNEDLKIYLYSLGLEFLTYTKDECEKFELLKRNDWEIEPYAVTKYVIDTLGMYDEINQIPLLKDVKKVNSKRFSSELSNSLKCNFHKSFVIGDFQELKQMFLEFNHKPIVIKEFFGVSGKGSLVLKDWTSKNSILKYLYKQEQKGKNINFIVEEYLDKKADFSTHISISASGQLDIITNRMMKNSNLSYQGSYEMDINFKRYLIEREYFLIIEEIVKKIYESGYWGKICIDSMILFDNTIIPLVEINARESMGLLHYYLEKRLGIKESILAFYNLKIPNHIKTKDVLEALDRGGILFRNKGEGIVVLSGNLLELGGDNNILKYRNGRLYFVVLSVNKDKTISKLAHILKGLNIIIY